MANKSLALNALLNTAKTVLGLLFPLITYPYISRVLGVDNIGIYNFSASFLSYFLLLASLGIPTYGIREGARIRDDKEIIHSFVNELFSINLYSTVISYLLLFIFLLAIPFMYPYRFVILILSGEILFTTLSVSWVCNIYEDFLFIAVRSLMIQILSLVLIFVFVKTEDDLYSYIWVLLLSNSGANLMNYFYIRNKYFRFIFTFKINWNKHLKPILVIFSTTIAITIYVSSDTTMLGFMTDNYNVGLYSTAVKIYTIIKTVLVAVLMVLIPRFTIVFSKGDRNQSNILFSKVFGVITVIMLPMCVGLFSLSEDIVLIISGSAYIGATTALRVLSFAVAFSLYAFMYTQCVLIPTKSEDQVFKATAIGAIVNIVLNLVLIPIWGINAAAFTTVVAEAITFLIAMSYSRKAVSLINVRRIIITTLVGCFFIVLVCLLFSVVDDFVARVAMSILGSAIVYVIVLLVGKNPVLGILVKMIDRRTVNR